jgi:dienelactone hydrolase
MKIVLPFLLCLTFLLYACDDALFGSKEEENPEEEFNEHEPGVHIQQQVRIHFGSSIAGFYEALPASYHLHKYKKYPLLISILGAGERGDGSEEELKVVLRPYTPAKLIAAKTFPKDFYIDGHYYSFIVLSVQMVTDRRALPVDIDKLIQYAKTHYRVDESRIYLTGISLGAGTVWDYAVDNEAYARNLAAITPMAGKSVGPSKLKAKVIADADLPVWGFHSKWDTAVPSTNTSNYVNWINSYQPGLARMTLFPDSSHICWRWSYDPEYMEEDSVNVYEWMLMHKRAAPEN